MKMKNYERAMKRKEKKKQTNKRNVVNEYMFFLLA